MVGPGLGDGLAVGHDDGLVSLSLEELLRQLRELDPAFYRCFPYRDTLSMGASEALFLGVNATKLAKVAVASFEPTTDAGGMEKKEAKHVGGVCYSRLARCARAGDELCEGSPWA